MFASFELYSLDRISKGRCGEQAKSFCLFFFRDCAHLLATRCFGTAPGSISFPVPAPVPRCYEVGR